MHFGFVRLVVVGLVAFILGVVGAQADSSTGAIKKFVRFPVQTYGLTGMLERKRLEESDVQPLSQVLVTGIWPDRKLLLIEIGSDAYYILYSSVEMNDQTMWDDRMRASGNLVCVGRVGSSRPITTGATKGFVSPCP